MMSKINAAQNNAIEAEDVLSANKRPFCKKASSEDLQMQTENTTELFQKTMQE